MFQAPCPKLFIKELLLSFFSGILPTFYAVSQIWMNLKISELLFSRTFVIGYFSMWKFDSDFHCTSWFWWKHFTHAHAKHFTHGQPWYLETEILWKPLWWPSLETAIFACCNNKLFWEFWDNLVFLKRVNLRNKGAYSLQLKLKQFLSWTCECNFSRHLGTVYYIYRTLEAADRVSWHVAYIFRYWVIDLYSASWC